MPRGGPIPGGPIPGGPIPGGPDPKLKKLLPISSGAGSAERRVFNITVTT